MKRRDGEPGVMLDNGEIIISELSDDIFQLWDDYVINNNPSKNLFNRIKPVFDNLIREQENWNED